MCCDRTLGDSTWQIMPRHQSVFPVLHLLHCDNILFQPCTWSSNSACTTACITGQILVMKLRCLSLWLPHQNFTMPKVVQDTVPGQWLTLYGVHISAQRARYLRDKVCWFGMVLSFPGFTCFVNHGKLILPMNKTTIWKPLDTQIKHIMEASEAAIWLKCVTETDKDVESSKSPVCIETKVRITLTQMKFLD